jgi:uncharacterized membrane protein
MSRPGAFLVLLGQHLRRRIFSGLLIVLPLAATYLVIKFVFDIIDPPISDLVRDISGKNIPGVGLIIFLIILYLVGLVGSYVIGRRIIALGHRFAGLIPIVRPIYRTAKQTVDALGATNWREKYNRVVLLDFPRDGVKSIGFVTATYKDPKGKPMVAIYIPTSPIPTSGFLALVATDKVVTTNLTVDDAMKIVISGGVLTPETISEGFVSDEDYGGEEGAASNQ